jgi:hypothetical protein
VDGRRGTQNLEHLRRLDIVDRATARPKDMRIEQFRRRALDAQQRAGSASDPNAKAELEQIAKEWFALSEQLEWLNQRYDQLSSTAGVPTQTDGVAQQRQQIQPPGDE